MRTVPAIIWHLQPDGTFLQPALANFDASSRDLFMPSLYPPFEAQTLGELATRLELDTLALEHTVSEFNAAVLEFLQGR